jgi:hypothetical protein
MPHITILPCMCSQSGEGLQVYSKIFYVNAVSEIIVSTIIIIESCK